MQGSERLLEASQRSLDTERDAQLNGVRAQLDGEGEAYCVDCDEPIDVARRMALPSARRCIDCQRRRERRR